MMAVAKNHSPRAFGCAQAIRTDRVCHVDNVYVLERRCGRSECRVNVIARRGVRRRDAVARASEVSVHPDSWLKALWCRKRQCRRGTDDVDMFSACAQRAQYFCGALRPLRVGERIVRVGTDDHEIRVQPRHLAQGVPSPCAAFGVVAAPACVEVRLVDHGATILRDRQQAPIRSVKCAMHGREPCRCNAVTHQYREMTSVRVTKRTGLCVCNGGQCDTTKFVGEG